MILPLSDDLVDNLDRGTSAALGLPVDRRSVRRQISFLVAAQEQARDAPDLLRVSAPLGNEVVDVEHVGRPLARFNGSGVFEVGERRGEGVSGR